MTSVNNINGSSNSNALSSSSLAKSGFSEQTFLQLLVTQLKYQDPMNPQDSTQFVAELANFSTLEQMTSMNKSVESTLEMSAASLIGKTATVTDNTSDSGYVTGTITGIQYYADGPAVKINGKDYAFSAVQSLAQ